MGKPEQGWVTQVRRLDGVSRQTLSRWAATGAHALEAALGSPVLTKKPPFLPALVLTLRSETHARYRDIQACVKHMHGIDLRVGCLAGIITEAGQQAQERQHAVTPRALALDEQYGSQRGKASVNVSAVHRGHVWATVPPVAGDGDRWTLVVWSVQEQGITSACTGSDGGHAIAEARSQTHGDTNHQREVWHLF